MAFGPLVGVELFVKVTGAPTQAAKGVNKGTGLGRTITVNVLVLLQVVEAVTTSVATKVPVLT